MDENRQKIAALNDAFRRSGQGGQIVATQGVAALPPEEQQALLAKVRLFDEFNQASDPYGEHEFGAIEHSGEKYFWKIDYYDKNREYGSEDPADPEQTTRVMTIMQAHEY